MSVNKVILVGNITRDAEVRTVGQNQVARFGLATNNKYRNSQGETIEETEFHNIEYWGGAGVHQYLKKGQQVYVEGSIKTDKWTGQDGQEKSTVKIKASSLQLLGLRQQPQQGQAPAQPQRPQQRPAPQPPRQQKPAPPSPVPPPIPSDMENWNYSQDDIPF